MTLHRLPTAQGLLARKGAAAPALETKDPSTAYSADADAGDDEMQESQAEPFQLALVSIGDAESAPDAALEPPPPASLLPFTLYRKGRAAGATNGTAASKPESGPAEAPATQDVAAEPETAAAPVAPAPADSASAPAEAQTDVSEKATEPETRVEPAEAAAPADSADQETATVAPLAAVGGDPVVVSQRGAPWAAILGGLAACLAIVAIGWAAFEFQPQEPGAPAASKESATPTAVPPAPAAKPGPAESTEAAPAPEAVAPADTTPIQTLDPDTATAAPDDQPAAVPAAETPTESIDVVRIDDSGNTVIAGRAAPHGEVIVLDNGKPIGTAAADAFGEWVFVSPTPLPDGDHEFGLVPKAVTGTATVPAIKEKHEPGPPATETKEPSAVPSDSEPVKDLSVPPPPRKPSASAVPDGLVVPVPPRKPDGQARSAPAPNKRSAAEPSADFVVQLASVKTRAGAEQEWEKLLKRFPAVLSGMNLQLDEAKLEDQGTVVRVRTGPFVGLDDAREFCARIQVSRQDCLVVRTDAVD